MRMWLESPKHYCWTLLSIMPSEEKTDSCSRGKVRFHGCSGMLRVRSRGENTASREGGFNPGG